MKAFFSFVYLLILSTGGFGQSKALVIQTDFGLKDAAVSAMKGVAYGVSRDLAIFDNTHEIPAYNIWEAAYCLNQSALYWPSGTVFVSVVDPGVGSERNSIVMKSKTGHFFVTPDNGTITLVADQMGVEEIRLIDESKNRLSNSSESYTFHGRDVYAYTGARLAAGIITFEEVGPVLTTKPVRLTYEKPALSAGNVVGNIDILDIQYGNIWTNIDKETFSRLDVPVGSKLRVKIKHDGKIVYDGTVVYGRTFSDVGVGESLAYLNSLLKLSFGINQGSFAERFKVKSGPGWTVEVTSAR